MTRSRPWLIGIAAGVAGIFYIQTPASADVINDLFVFGDSYSDTGSYTVATNGTTWAGYLAQDFGITLTTINTPDPGTDGVNFAESGARVFVGPTSPATQPRSLVQQVAEFQNYVTAGEVTFDPYTTLFFLAGGLNDHDLVTSAQVNAATAQMVASLYSLGARLFEIALLPADVSFFTDSANNFNPGYMALVPKLQAEYPDAVFALTNWGPDYDAILSHPSAYGLTNTTDPCAPPPSYTQQCSTPDTYFYYYPLHPSTFVHQIVGNEIYQEVLGLPSPVPEPTTWAMILVGFLGLGFAGYRKAKATASAA
jgi:cholinesterase